jgi:hypothetical protein
VSHSRKYGDKESHPIPLWNGVFEHYDRIGDALWEFAWCIDRITEERDGVGIVLGGSPVKLRAIVDALKGSRKETVRRHMDSLEKENYIRRRRTPYGHVIEVLNSRKFGIWKHSKEKPQNDVSPPIEKPIYGSEKPTGGSEKPKNSINKEDSAVTQHKDAAVRPLPACDLWNLIGVRREKMPPAFAELSEGLFANKNGQSLSEFMGVCMDGWSAMGKKRYPPEFARAKAKIKACEREKTPLARGLPYLEPMPPLPCRN